MTRRMLLIPVQGPVQAIDVGPGIDGMRTAIGGGWIERVRVAADWALAVDEDGIAKQLPINATASTLYGVHSHGQYIRGDVLLGREEFVTDGRDWVDLDEDEATAWLVETVMERSQLPLNSKVEEQ